MLRRGVKEVLGGKERRGFGFKRDGIKTVDLEWPLSPLFLYLIRKWGRKGRVGGKGVSGGDGRSVEGLKRMA